MSAVLTANVQVNIRLTADELPLGVDSKVANTAILKKFAAGAGAVIREVSGQFTPNNDYVTVMTFTPTTQASLLLVVTDKPIGLYLSDTVSAKILSVVIDGFALLKLKPFSPSTQAQLILDARPGITSTPVVQGDPVKYYIAALTGDVV